MRSILPVALSSLLLAACIQPSKVVCGSPEETCCAGSVCDDPLACGADGRCHAAPDASTAAPDAALEDSDASATYPDAQATGPDAQVASPDAGGPDSGPGPGLDAGASDACAAATCEGRGGACGSFPDGCGGTLVCGCPTGLGCSDAGTCACTSTAWTTVTVDPKTEGTHYASLALDPQGGAHMAYVNDDHGWRYAYLAPDVNQPPVIERYDTTTPTTGTSIGADAEGGLHVSYYRWVNQGGNFWDGTLVYGYRAPGGTWTLTEQRSVGTALYVQGGSSTLLVDSAGGVHLFFYEWTETSAKLRYGYRAPKTASFQLATIEAGPTVSTWTSTGSIPALVDAAGALRVAWFDYVSFSLRYATKAAGSSTWTVETAPIAAPASSTQDVGFSAALAADAQGNGYAAYVRSVSSTSVVLELATRAPGGAWIVETTPIEGATVVGGVSGLAVDGQGRLRVGYQDYSGKAFKYAWRDPAGAWSTEIADASGDDGWEGTMRLDAHQVTRAVYGEYVTDTSGALRYAHRCH